MVFHEDISFLQLHPLGISSYAYIYESHAILYKHISMSPHLFSVRYSVVRLPVFCYSKPLTNGIVWLNAPALVMQSRCYTDLQLQPMRII